MTIQCVKRNKFWRISRAVRTVCLLSNPEKQTGHTFRSAYVSLLADSEVELTFIRRYRLWKSSSAPEDYLKNFNEQKKWFLIG